MLKNIFLITLFVLISCDRSDIRNSIEMNWEIINNSLPNNIIVYEGYNAKIPIRAWAVLIPNVVENKIKVLASNDQDGLDTPQNFATKNNATVVINGGYFSKSSNMVHHIGLLKTHNQLVEPASGTVIRENIRYNVA